MFKKTFLTFRENLLSTLLSNGKYFFFPFFTVLCIFLIQKKVSCNNFPALVLRDSVKYIMNDILIKILQVGAQRKKILFLERIFFNIKIKTFYIVLSKKNLIFMSLFSLKYYRQPHWKKIKNLSSKKKVLHCKFLFLKNT